MTWDYKSPNCKKCGNRLQTIFYKMQEFNLCPKCDKNEICKYCEDNPIKHTLIEYYPLCDNCPYGVKIEGV